METQAFHFFASSAIYWRTSENLKDLIKTMDKLSEKNKYPYVMFYVPLSEDAKYEINNYVPQIKEKVYLGSSDESRISYTSPSI